MSVADSKFLQNLYSSDLKEMLSHNYFIDQIGDQLDHQVKISKNRKLETVLEFDQLKRFPYYILRRVDHLSMAHAVEARMPFLQPSIIRLAQRLEPNHLHNGRVGKLPVINAARDFLPSSIINRKKQPFTLPVIAMIKRGEKLYDYINDTLMSSNTAIIDLFNKKFIEELFIAHEKSPSPIAANTLWSLMIMERWMKHRNLSF